MSSPVVGVVRLAVEVVAAQVDSVPAQGSALLLEPTIRLLSVAVAREARHLAPHQPEQVDQIPYLALLPVMAVVGAVILTELQARPAVLAVVAVAVLVAPAVPEGLAIHPLHRPRKGQREALDQVPARLAAVAAAQVPQVETGLVTIPAARVATAQRHLFLVAA